MEYLTLLIVDRNDINTNKKVKSTFDWLIINQEHAPIFIFKDNEKQKFKRFLKALPLDTHFFLLFHLGIKKKLDPLDRHNGEVILDKFGKILPGLKNHKYYFSQTSVKGVDGTVFTYANLINNKLEEKHLLSPANILYNQFNPVKSYTIEDNTPDNYLNEYLIGESTLKNILGACIIRSKLTQDDVSDIKIDFLSPGYSGAYVAIISYLQKNRNNRIFRLLKFSKNHSSLYREKVKGNYLYENANLPENFIGARLDYDGVIIDGYLCLLFNYEKAEDLVKVIARLLDQAGKKPSETLFNMLEVVLDEFGVFITKASNVDKSSERINPWSNSELGLKPALWFVIKAKFTIQKIQDLFDTALLNKYGLSEENLDLLDNYLIPKNEKNELIKYKAIKVPEGIIHGDLHARNILIKNRRKNLKDVYFIDFALMNNMKQKQNVLLDLAHLCVDIEIAFIPENHLDASRYFHFSNSFLQNRFLEGKSNKAIKDAPKAFAVYEMANLILDYTLSTYRTIKKHDSAISFPENELRLQFHLARLHYLIKRIAFDNVSREKILFICRIALDIFQYIEKKQKEILEAKIKD